jgi:2-desacetyl-2-hydroxyethyl bacteriochlorophyllide A dehydrogenase
MRALLFHGPNDLRLEERPTPEPGAGEVRVEPHAVGLCGSDTHMLRGEMPAARPVVFGHEIAGVIDAVGPDVTGVEEGDLVTIEPHVYCKACRYCRLGREHLCLQKRAFGVHLNGGLEERLVVPTYTAFRLPPGITAEIGCLAEPVACCIHGMDRLAPRSGTPLLIIGAGPAGLILTRLAQLAGAAPIVVSEPNPERRAAALAFGADHALDPTEAGWGESLDELTEGQGFDSVIEAVGAPATVELAVARAARGGRVLLFGVAPMDAVARLRPYEIFARELTLIGTVINPYTHERAVRLLPRLGLERLTFATFPLEDYRAAFEAQASGAAGLKVEIHPSSGERS